MNDHIKHVITHADEWETADKLPLECPECGRPLRGDDGDMCYDCWLNAHVAASAES
jgi:hypothetical protein